MASHSALGLDGGPTAVSSRRRRHSGKYPPKMRNARRFVSSADIFRKPGCSWGGPQQRGRASWPRIVRSGWPVVPPSGGVPAEAAFRQISTRDAERPAFRISFDIFRKTGCARGGAAPQDWPRLVRSGWPVVPHSGRVLLRRRHFAADAATHRRLNAAERRYISHPCVLARKRWLCQMFFFRKFSDLEFVGYLSRE